jgi:hypothetical protein
MGSAVLVLGVLAVQYLPFTGDNVSASLLLTLATRKSD